MIDNPTGGTPPVQGENADQVTVTMDQLVEAMSKAATTIMVKRPHLIMFADDFVTIAALAACILFDKEKED